jgi:TPP-dependent pyruvate/acetoin dehydrogenase alpha subunit
VKLFVERLLASGTCAAEEIDAVDREIGKEVEDAVEFARAARLPQLSEVSLYVYPES